MTNTIKTITNSTQETVLKAHVERLFKEKAGLRGISSVIPSPALNLFGARTRLASKSNKHWLRFWRKSTSHDTAHPTRLRYLLHTGNEMS